MKLAHFFAPALAGAALLAVPGCRAQDRAVLAPQSAQESVQATQPRPAKATRAALQKPASSSPTAREAIDGAGLSRFPYVQMTTPTSAVLVWNTRLSSLARVQVRRAEAPESKGNSWRELQADPSPRLQHIVPLSGLIPASKYLYRVGDGKRTLAQAAFETARKPGQKFRAAVWGDSGVDSVGQKKLARQIDKANPNLLLHTGDLIYPAGEARLFDPNFFSIYRPTLARVPFYGALGNHDIDTRNGAPFLRNFVFPRNGPREVEPERCFSFDYADAHIAILDSNLEAQVLEGSVSRWLASDMSASKLKWKLVAFHHPPITDGLHGDEARTRALMPLFSRLHIDLVLNGHDHMYERTRPIGGVTYLVTGAGGAPRYPRRKHRSDFQAFENRVFSFTLLEFAPGKLSARQVDEDGRTLDAWSLSK